MPLASCSKLAAGSPLTGRPGRVALAPAVVASPMEAGVGARMEAPLVLARLAAAGLQRLGA